MSRVLPLLMILCTAACTSNVQRIDRFARDARLQRQVVTGAGYRHVVYMSASTGKHSAASERLMVFIDGDGRPWSDDGRRPSTDPTTRHPIALQLLASTGSPGIYISRPCYQQMVDEHCSQEIWTGGRYSRQVVESMATVVRRISRERNAAEIVLVGYSGGGALAVLIAEQLTDVAAVITLGANLDTDAWTRQHGYLPLTTSLNPAASERPHSWREIHFIGEQDKVVPAQTRANYFSKFPQAREWKVSGFDHVCCWVNEWPSLLQKIELPSVAKAESQ